MKKLEIQLNKKNLSGRKIFLDKIEPGCIYSFPKHGFVTSRTFSEKSIFSEGRYFLNLKHLCKTEDEAVVYDQSSLHNSNSRFSLGFSEETQFGFSEYIDTNSSFHQDNSGIDNALHGSMEFDNGNEGYKGDNDSNINSEKTIHEKLPNMIHEIKKVDHLPCEKCIRGIKEGPENVRDTIDNSRKPLEELFRMRLGFYNRHFVNYVSKGMNLDDIDRVKENERLRLFMDGTENCLSFNAFMEKIRIMNNEDLYNDVVEFEIMLLYNSNKELFKHAHAHDHDHQAIPLLDYIESEDVFMQDPIFSHGMVTIDERSSVNVGIKKFKETWSWRYKGPQEGGNGNIDNTPTSTITPSLGPLTLPFLSEWEAMRKNMTKTYNSNRGYASNIILNPSLRMNLNDAFASGTLPPCGMFILEQIIRDKRATFPIRGSMAVMYDLGFTEEEIIGFMEENIHTNDIREKEEEISSVTDLIKNKWRYSSTSIRSLYPGFKVVLPEKGRERSSNGSSDNNNSNSNNNNRKKSNTCGKGCKSMIMNPIYSDKEGLSQTYGCPLINHNELEKYKGIIGDIEDLASISQKECKDLKDVSKVTSVCSDIMEKRLCDYTKDKIYHKDIKRNRHRMPHEAYLNQLLGMGKDIDVYKK